MSKERWDELSDAFAEFDELLGEDTREAAVLAKAFRAQLEKYLGGANGSVLMFDYDPVTETYIEDDNPFAAVSYFERHKWFLGYGVTLERSPTAWPKTNFQFPVWFTLSEPVVVDTSFGEVSLDRNNIDFSPACEHVYNGLREALKKRSKKTPGGAPIGFVNFPEPG